MATTTWTQTAGMVSEEDTDNVQEFADQAEASKDAAAASAASASTSATNAATSASNAAASASAASTSTSAAQTAQAAAETAKTGAETARTGAETAQTGAQTAQAAAETAETGATTAQTAAEAAQAAAETAETNAATSASNASTSETNASTSASNAATSASDAASSLASVQTIFDNFDDRYLGSKTSDPTVDNDGNALLVGTIYWNSVSEELRFWNGSAWEAPSAAAANSASAAATSASSAATSATASASSASASATSATSSATSAAASATSATAAANSATAAATSEANADTSEANALTYSSNAATSASQAAASAAGIAGYDLDNILETKAVTATDVFVYDTSKDSDGGAWRKRTQHTSWYNETLNTSTRGSRREFPSVAVIVATHGSDGNQLRIFDGDNPSLPMWMTITDVIGGAGHVGTKTSCYALNGMLTFGTPIQGLRGLNFISDIIFGYKSTLGGGATGESKNPIAKRNEVTAPADDWTKDYPALVNANVNDVAMTVLPNAPIDAATGLPVPTIAVATDGGISVITDSGVVYDITDSSGNGAWLVDFTDDNRIMFQHGGAATGINARIMDIPTSDVSSFGGAYYANNPTAALQAPLASLYGITAKGEDKGLGFSSTGGLVQLAENTTTPSEGMLARSTSSYNTGWMNGDIKGAFLSDTDTSNLVGSGELISNGTFSDEYGTFGWYLDTGNRDAYLKVENNTLTFVHGNTNNLWEGFGTSVSCTVGETYVVELTVDASTSMNPLRVSNTSSQHDADYAFTGTNSVGTHTATFVATATTMYLHFNGYNSASTITLSNISVKLADADRSVNNNGLIVSSTTYDPWHDDLNLSFDTESFTVDREASDFMSAITHDASSNATMTGGYGPELVTNGDFSNGSTGWTTGASFGGEIADGRALLVDQYDYIDQTLAVTNGMLLELTYNVLNQTGTGSGSHFALSSNGFTNNTDYLDDTAGVHKVIVEVVDDTKPLRLVIAAAVPIEIDNISVREIPKVQWRPHNLLSYSEDFTQWSTNGTITVTADDTAAPDGTTTADKVAFGSSTSDSIWRGGAAYAGETLTFSVWAKAASATTVRLRFWDTDSGSQYSSDLSIGTSWTLLTHTATIGSAATTSNFSIYNNSTGTTSDIHVWGAHLYRSDLGGMAEVPSDLRTANSTTYVRTAGREVTGTEVYTASGQSGVISNPDDPWFSVENLGQVSISSDTLTFNNSSWETVRRDLLTAGKAYSVTFDITRTSGTFNVYIGSSSAAKSISASGTYTLSLTAGDTRIAFGGSNTVGTVSNISVKEIDVDPSSARYLPRLGHHVYNGSAWVNEGLLHESEARTNLVTYSEDLTDASWSKVEATLSGNTVVPNTNNVTHELFSASVSVTSGQTYTISFEAEAAGYDWLQFVLTTNLQGSGNFQNFNLSNNTLGSGDATLLKSIVDMGNGVSKISISITANGTGTGMFALGPRPDDGTRRAAFAGDGTSGVTINRVQFEQGATPSSYIPTSGSTATRASESLTIPAANLPYSSTAMTIQMDGRMTYADNDQYTEVNFVNWRDTSTNLLTLKIDAFGTRVGTVYALINTGSNYADASTGEYLPDVMVPYNVSGRYISSEIEVAKDGIASNDPMPITALPSLGSSNLLLGDVYNGTIRGFRMWGNDIKDDGIEIVTQPSLEPSLSLSFDGTEASHVKFDWSE